MCMEYLTGPVVGICLAHIFMSIQWYNEERRSRKIKEEKTKITAIPIVISFPNGDEKIYLTEGE